MTDAPNTASSSVLTRRRILALGGLAAAATGVGLAACAPGTGAAPDGGASRSGGAAQLPAYIPATLVKPDLPATDYGASPGFLTYPETQPAFFSGPAGNGGDLSTLSVISRTITMDASNGYWDALTKQLGVNWKPQGAPIDNYAAKFATVIAGNEVPDAVQILAAGAPQLPKLLEAKFADLTPYLAGDAVKDYPALANIPTNSWRSTIYNDAIYAVPLHRSALMWVGSARMDLLKAQGLPTQPKDGQELLEMYRGLTDASKKQFALAFPDWVLAYVCQCTGAPNDWRNENGTFTKDYETEQYRQAIDIVASMWKEGLFHPESYASSNSQGSDWYHNGVVNGLVLQGSWAFHQARTQAVTPTADVNWFAPPKWDGGGTASSYVGPGIFSITAVKKGSDERVKEVLRVLDRMAAPFGSAESTLQTYGRKDVDWTLKNGIPTATEEGKKTTWATWYTSYRPQVHFAAMKQSVTDQHASEVALLKDGTPSPVVDLYSDTAQAKSATLSRNIQAAAADIITGRKPLASWDEAVAAWRSGGGDTMRKEYAEAQQKRG